MAPLSAAQKKFLGEATSRYHASLPGSPAAEHLESRGLLAPSVRDLVDKYRLGFVDDPLPGHEQYQGMLAIPYLRWAPRIGWSVATMRFRCLLANCDHGGHRGGKYASMPEHPPRIYNTLALLDDTDDIGVTEGEFDAITASVSGIPTIGIPGADAWRKHFREPLLGYRHVYVFTDGDRAGNAFGELLIKELPNALIVPMPTGEDVSSLVLKHGKHALLERTRT
ncbi:hypothetical protein LX90_003721 [Lentzea flava]|nr:hypothetical protein [Lentzea flava]